jgi:hypothetical protein
MSSKDSLFAMTPNILPHEVRVASWPTETTRGVLSRLEEDGLVFARWPEMRPLLLRIRVWHIGCGFYAWFQQILLRLG